MNQILQTTSVGAKNMNQNTEQYHERKQPSFQGPKTKMSIYSIVKIFAITLILFGIALIGNGSIALTESAKQKENIKRPTLQIERSGNVLNLKIQSEVQLRTIGYSWNEEEFNYVSAKKKNEIKMSINIPEGENNKLEIVVIDMEKNRNNFKEKYSMETDVTEPKIEVSNEDPQIKVTITDDTALDHVTYKYGETQEQIIYADSENPTIIEFKVDIESGEKVLMIEAVDAAQNHAEKSEKIKGVTKPQIEIAIASPDDPSILAIKVTDEENLQKIVVYVGEERFTTGDLPIDKKEFSFRIPVKESGTTVRVEAYNVNEKMAEKSVTINY